jgi:hypothetical protein
VLSASPYGAETTETLIARLNTPITGDDGDAAQKIDAIRKLGLRKSHVAVPLLQRYQSLSRDRDGIARSLPDHTAEALQRINETAFAPSTGGDIRHVPFWGLGTAVVLVAFILWAHTRRLV